MLCLNSLFKHSTDLWLTANMQVLTSADVTFELLVDKGRSEAASPGYSLIATGYSTIANGYFGQMSPSLQPVVSTSPQIVRKSEFTVRYSHPSDSLRRQTL